LIRLVPLELTKAFRGNSDDRVESGDGTEVTRRNYQRARLSFGQVQLTCCLALVAPTPSSKAHTRE
jgi:hypothetical protein